MRLAFVLFLVFLAPEFALAHHGGSEYDMTKTVEFKAKLTRVEMINPHSWIYFDVPEKDGTVSHHRCEMRSVHVLRRSGWTKENFPVGQQITIEASPNEPIPPRAICKPSWRPMERVWIAMGNTSKRHRAAYRRSGDPSLRPRTDRPARRPSGEPNISGDWAPVQLVMVNAKGIGRRFGAAR